MNITVTGILSYPNLHRAATLENYPNNPPKFRCTVLLKKGSDDLRKIESKIEQLKHNKWVDKVPLNFELKCLIDLNNDPVTENYVALKALNSEDNKPIVVDENGEEIITPAQCIAGTICQMSVSLYAYDKSGNGVSAGINGVMIMNTMGELGILGRDRLTVAEMFGNQSVPPFVEEDDTPFEPAAKKEYTMTDAAKKFGWHKRSDVSGEWDHDDLLLKNGYMLEVFQTNPTKW